MILNAVASLLIFDGCFINLLHSHKCPNKPEYDVHNNQHGKLHAFLLVATTVQLHHMSNHVTCFIPILTGPRPQQVHPGTQKKNDILCRAARSWFWCQASHHSHSHSLRIQSITIVDDTMIWYIYIIIYSWYTSSYTSYYRYHGEPQFGLVPCWIPVNPPGESPSNRACWTRSVVRRRSFAEASSGCSWRCETIEAPKHIAGSLKNIKTPSMIWVSSLQSWSWWSFFAIPSFQTNSHKRYYISISHGRKNTLNMDEHGPSGENILTNGTSIATACNNQRTSIDYC
jgi:hypothetical protein